MPSFDHVPYLITFLAALYIAQSFVLQLVRGLQPRPAPESVSADAIIEIIKTALRHYGIDKHINEVLEPHRAAHHELRNALTAVAQAVESLQRDMSTCKTNITDIAASLNQIAPLIQSLKKLSESAVAQGVVAEKDVHSFSDTRRTPFFKRKSSEDNALRDSPPTAKVTDSPTKSAAEKASELADAMMAHAQKATDVVLEPLPPPSAERHNRDLIG